LSAGNFALCLRKRGFNLFLPGRYSTSSSYAPKKRKCNEKKVEIADAALWLDSPENRFPPIPDICLANAP
jgi:hypothetical protein